MSGCPFCESGCRTPLESVMHERGITASALADFCGLGASAVRYAMAGKGEPSLNTARRIAWGLGLTIDDLWPCDEEEAGLFARGLMAAKGAGG